MGPQYDFSQHFWKKNTDISFKNLLISYSFFLKIKKVSTGIWTPALKMKGEYGKTDATGKYILGLRTTMYYTIKLQYILEGEWYTKKKDWH